MNAIDEKIMKLKEQAKKLLNENTSKEDADNIMLLDKGLDDLIQENNKSVKSYDLLKNDYITLLKTSGSSAQPSQEVEQELDMSKDSDFMKVFKGFNDKQALK